MKFAELEIQRKNASHFDKNIAQVFYKEDYSFISNTLQESIKDTEILPALSSDHSPILFSLVSTEPASEGKRLWKFKNSLLLNEEFVTKIRNCIYLKIYQINHENINDDQIRWKFLKYKVRKFSRKLFKTLIKELRQQLRILENKLKLYEFYMFAKLRKT